MSTTHNQTHPLTAQDIVAYLLASTAGGAQDGEHQAIRQAVVNGVREVMTSRNWLFHTSTGYFETTQPSTTATITLGSANITVASAANFVVGRLLHVSGSHFSHPLRITAVNGNVVTVSDTATQSGSGVTVKPQIYYDLPNDLRDIDTLITNTAGTLHCYIPPDEWQRLEVMTQGAGEPYYYTVMKSDTTHMRWQIRFVGVPTSGTVVNYTYRRTPIAVKYMGYERICRQGTVAASGGVVTGTDTNFPLDADNGRCVIRYAYPAELPNAKGATIEYQSQSLIESVTSATSLTINNSPNPPIAAGTKYAITDLIDASPAMFSAVLAACEMWYARVAGRPMEQALAVYNRDLRIAMELDAVTPLSGRASNLPYRTPRTMGWHSPPLPDVE